MSATTPIRRGWSPALLCLSLSLVAVAPGCGEQPSACVIATEGCACTPSGACDPGLSCWSSLCVRPADAGANMSTSVMAPPPPPPPPMSGADAAPRDGGITLASDGPAGQPPPPSGTGNRWTVFVYGHADHNLSPSMLADLAEMAQARLTDDVQVVALVDWNSKLRMPRSMTNFPAGTFLYRPRGGGKLETVGMTDELDFDDPSVLADAIQLAFTRYPADRYGLVMWDHGGAFRGGFGSDSQNGTRRGQPMSIPVVAAAMKAGLDKAGLTGVRPLEFLSFDTCLMSGVEINTAFADLAKVYISNAELDYGPGWDYEATLGWLAANPGASALDFARAESMAWDAHHRDDSAVDGYFRSHAAWDMSRWGEFVSASRTLATAIRNNDAAAATARAMFFSLPSYHKAADAAGLDLRDVGDVFQGLAGSSVPPVARAAQDALAAARAARITGANGQFRQQQIGLHVFGGQLAALPAAGVQAYPRLASAWSAASGWGDLLTYLTGAVPPGVPQFTGMGAVPARPTRQDPPRVDFQTTNPEVAYAESLFMAPDPDDSAVLINHGVIAHGIIGPGQHKVHWPGWVMAIAATPQDVPVTVTPWTYTAEGGMTGMQFRLVNGALRADGDELPVGLLMDKNYEASEIIIDDGSGGFSVLSLPAVVQMNPQLTFVPTLDVFDARIKEFTTQRAKVAVVVPASGKIGFRGSLMGAGEYLVGVFVVDVWGKSTGQLFDVDLTGPVAQ